MSFSFFKRVFCCYFLLSSNVMANSDCQPSLGEEDGKGGCTGKTNTLSPDYEKPIQNLFVEIRRNADRSRTIDGKKVAGCSESISGTSGVTCYQFSDEEKFYFKNKFYILSEPFESVAVSILLTYLADRLNIKPFSPMLKFAMNEKKEFIGILSYHLKGFQSIADLYKKCSNQSCINDANKQNLFYCFSKEQMSLSLSLLYNLLFLVGGGDTNPGNICYTPSNVCPFKDSSFHLGTFDIDLSFKKHASKEKFERYKKICEGFVKLNQGIVSGQDQCARNLLSLYGENPIAIQDDPEKTDSYFLETGDSGLRENLPTVSAYTNYLCAYKPCKIKIDPYNYGTYAKDPPLAIVDIARYAEDLIKSTSLDALIHTISDVFDQIRGGLNLGDEASPQGMYFKNLKQNALRIVKERYKILECYAENPSAENLSTLRRKCHTTSNNPNMEEIETLCKTPSKECHEKIKQVLASLVVAKKEL